MAEEKNLVAGKNKMYRRRYTKYIKEMIMNDEVKGDVDEAHRSQEAIYEKFINDIAGNKYKTIEEVTQVARQLKLEVIEYSKDKTRYFS